MDNMCPTYIQVPEWLPIETAPKDGTAVRLWGTVAFKHYDSAPLTEYSHEMEIIGIYERWVTYGDTEVQEGWVPRPNIQRTIIIYPTKWQPLGEPPMSEEL